MKRQIFSITQKELSSYFGSLLAIIFLGTFLAAVLFIFFTVDTFFALGDCRYTAVIPLDAHPPHLPSGRPHHAPVERRTAGRHRRTAAHPTRAALRPGVGQIPGRHGHDPHRPAADTRPLPITVSLLGNLDWGPVFGGYLAALLMAGAYAAIGLFVSSRTDNQIVALISTVLLGGLFYVLGTQSITHFFGSSISEILWAIGTGSRFESIQRGVIDLRDLVYYLSLTAIFLTLNTISLDRIRWSQKQTKYRQRVMRTVGLIIANLILLNVWLYPLHGLRLDLTEQKEYSLSQTTEDLFVSLQEPLLIRAYISEQTHPLLTPLIPQIRDMLREYEITADGRLTAEVIDPTTDPAIEAEANQTYGIQPFPFQASGRYETSVINAYFHILVRYGDQSVVLSFQDIVQVNQLATGDVSVRLKNLEYDLTSSIKKVVFGFQSIDSVLAALPEPVRLTFYITSNTLPPDLGAAESTISQVAQQIGSDANGKFVYQVIDLDDPNSPVDRTFLQQTYGLQPLAVSFLSADTFYAHMILENGDNAELLYPPADATEGNVRTTIEAALKRTASGFLKVVGIWSPPPAAPDPTDPFGGQQTALTNYSLIRNQLAAEYEVQDVDLSTGQVPPGIDMLMVLAPQDLTDIELFALDQYLMRGGSITLAVSPFQLNADPVSGGIALLPNSLENVTAWLASYGLTLQNSLVLDTQNQPFPVVSARPINGGAAVQEVQAVDYPFFVDVRSNGMAANNPIAANLPSVMLSWASPLALDEAPNGGLNEGRETEVLLRSSADSWTQATTNVLPNFDLYPNTGFEVTGERQRQVMAVSLNGRFPSYFTDKPSPFENQAPVIDPATGLQQPPLTQPFSTIAESPDSSRLVVISSAAFVEDDVLNLAGFLNQSNVTNNLQFMQNVVDWSVEDLDLLSIRGRGTATRVLFPLTEQQQASWEIANYVIALVALVVIYAGWRRHTKNEKPLVLVTVETGD
ncbi:MAG: Gldg family protein [Ardenticatenaceae bacterium]|nr:Gldg family protein [Ardenticatenaceae bacterium]